MPTGGKSKRPCHAALGEDALKVQSPTASSQVQRLGSPVPLLPRRSCSTALTGEPTGTTAFWGCYNRALQTPADFVMGSRDISVFEIAVTI